MPWDDWFGGPTSGTDGTGGIYPNANEVEKAVSAELINPDGSKGFQINAGIEIQGGSSDQRWKDDKLSMRLKFKDIYGDGKLDYDLFGGTATNNINTLILDSVLRTDR